MGFGKKLLKRRNQIRACMQRLELAKGESGHKGEQPATVAEDGEEKR